MKIVDDNPSLLTALDRPNSYIGRSVPRPNLARLTEGRGHYVSDVTLPRMVHVAFVRSPHAHARIAGIGTAVAKKSPGVVAVVTGAELAKVITPWVGVLTHLKGIKSAPQYAIATERACWQGEAVCAVVARSRAEAEDACELVAVDYELLPVVTDAETALDAATPIIHAAIGDNLCFERVHTAGDPDKGFAEADAVVETTFVFGRHTGVTNEPRAIVADWNPGEQRLTVYHGTQAPHMMMNLFAKDGTPKLVPHCTYPLTGLRCVSRVYTELGTFELEPGGIRVLGTYGTSFDELQGRLDVTLTRLEDR